MKKPDQIIVSVPTFQIKDEVFISKDNLLERLKKMKEDAEFRFDDGDVFFGYAIAMDEIIEKLETQ